MPIFKCVLLLPFLSHRAPEGFLQSNRIDRTISLPSYFRLYAFLFSRPSQPRDRHGHRPDIQRACTRIFKSECLLLYHPSKIFVISLTVLPLSGTRTDTLPQTDAALCGDCCHRPGRGIDKKAPAHFQSSGSQETTSSSPGPGSFVQCSHTYSGSPRMIVFQFSIYGPLIRRLCQNSIPHRSYPLLVLFLIICCRSLDRADKLPLPVYTIQYREGASVLFSDFQILLLSNLTVSPSFLAAAQRLRLMGAQS